MGFSLKSAIGSVAGAVGTALGGPVGGVIGSLAGSALGGSSSSGSSPWSSVVSGAVGLGQDILSGWWNTAQQQKLNDKAFAQNYAMWNLQNAYNDPSAQMRRLEAAGLNKNLVYGGGNVTGNTTSNYPTYEPVKYSGVGDYLNRNQRKEIALAQLDLGMKEFQQRVVNQGIQNGIALEKLALYRKINDAMLKQYGETTRGKKLLNDFMETPLDFTDEDGKLNINGQQLNQLIRLFIGVRR